MSKRKTHESKPPERARWEYHTSGSGHTSRPELTINQDVPLAESDIDGAHINMEFSDQSPFEWHLSEIEDMSIQVLKNAGLQDNDLGDRVLELVDEGGFHQGKHVELHMAELLTMARGIRLFIQQGDIQSALFHTEQLGSNLREADIRFGSIASQARKGGEQEKQIPAVVTKLVFSMLKNNRQATVADLWKMIPSDDFVAPKIDGVKIYKKGDFLQFIKKEGGEWIPCAPPLKRSSFRKYVTDARKGGTH